MTSKKNWRGRMLVNMCGDITFENQEEIASDPFISNAYNPTYHPTLREQQDINTQPVEHDYIMQNSSSCNDNILSHSVTDMPSLNSSLLQASFSDLIGISEQDITTCDSPNQVVSMEVDQGSIRPNTSEISNTELDANPSRPIPIVSSIEVIGQEKISPEVGFVKKNDTGNLIMDETTGIFKQCDTSSSTGSEIAHTSTASSKKFSVKIIAQEHSPIPLVPKIPSDLENNVGNLILDEISGLFKPGSYDSIPSNIQENEVLNFILDDQTGEIIISNDDEGMNQGNETEPDMFDHSKDRKFNKEQRVKGKIYTGRKIEKIQEKPLLTFVTKGKREMKPKPCTHDSNVAKTTRSFLCASITEEDRRGIFEYFWGLETWQAKKAYIKNLVRIRPIVRRRKICVNDPKKQKGQGFDCYLPNANNELVRVCKSFFLSTLDMNNDTLSEWVITLSDSKPSSVNAAMEEQSSSRRSKTKNTPRNQVPKRKSLVVKEWLGLLPKMPSHYCRSTTTRVYVEDTFRSKTHMFKVFQKWCTLHEKEASRRKLFAEVLRNEKISIFRPRKDECDTCTAYKEGNLEEEVYKTHIEMKQEAYRSKEEAKSLCSSEILVITMDVQSVLLCPKLRVSVQYYKQKLQIHNFTLYVNNNNEVHLYVWHEGHGGVSANEFTSCDVDFINSKIDEGYKKAIIISDGCGYQNRNRVLSAALANLANDCGIEIEQRILEKGHTMMEVDSVHSTLEHLFKSPIFAPSDYIDRMAQARPRQPYIIHHLDFRFFKNYEAVCHLDSIRPGRKVGDPVVTDVRGFLYKNGNIFYKLRHSHDWELLPQRMRTIDTELIDLYTEPIKIEKSKHNSLQSLKKYMHRDYHLFYDNLQHD